MSLDLLHWCLVGGVLVALGYWAEGWDYRGDGTMGSTTGIDWTDSTWNPIRGCSKVSEGCRNCYAMSVATRFSGPGQPYEGLARMVNGKPAWTNRVAVIEKHMHDPLRWQKPRRIFVNSMSDLFHEAIPDAAIHEIFRVMEAAQRHTFQILTKRPERMAAYCQYFRPNLLPNVWLGTSVEDQEAADRRIPYLLATPAQVRFLSCEPLLGPISFARLSLHRLDWVIDGGESGRDYRPADPQWFRDIRDQCKDAGVAYFHKQNGGITPKANGKALDGEEWCEFPSVAA